MVADISSAATTINQFKILGHTYHIPSSPAKSCKLLVGPTLAFINM